MRTTVLHFVLLALGTSGLLAAPAVTLSQAAAPSGTDQWATPVNLSHSGSATNPMMVIDPRQRVHVLWKDGFAGYTYTGFEGGQWSRPVPVDLSQVFFGPPSSQTTSPPAQDAVLSISPASGPHFAASNADYIIGVWITGTKNSLYANRVLSDSFASAANWDKPALLATSAIAADVTADAAGHVYLAYVQNRDNPTSSAGVYFQSSSDSGSTWSAPVALDQSPYFRTMPSDPANVEIATADTGQATQVYVVWDNHPRRQVMSTWSTDGGSTWATPTQVDGPTLGSGAAGPFAIRIGAAKDNVLLTWQNGKPGANCTQFYKWSTNGGNTWSNRQPVPLGLAGCAQSSQIIVNQDQMLLVGTIQGQTYLQAWNGAHWSLPQLQPTLFSFEDPEIHSQVQYGCRQFAVSGGRLYVVGCDTGAGGDIWWTSRALDDTTDWFLPRSWSDPVEVARSSEAIQFLTVATSAERLHALWAAPDSTSRGGASAIYYANWDGTTWSTPVAVLRSAQGASDRPAVAVDAAGQLDVVWTGDDSHAIYFSRADAHRAYSPGEWTEPLRLSSPGEVVGAADIQQDSDGQLFVTFAVPINEGRGLYLTQSGDGGRTWTHVTRVFDAAAAGWDMVDQPRLAITADGVLHVLWARPMPLGGVASALYYARSGDHGQTWSNPEQVTTQAVARAELEATGGQEVHRLWTETNGQLATLRHEYSEDSGLTWHETAGVPDTSSIAGPIALTPDAAGQLHLIQVGSSSDGRLHLRHWLWAGQHWAELGDAFDLSLDTGAGVDAVRAVFVPSGVLGVLFSADFGASQGTPPPHSVFAVSRPFEATQAATEASIPTATFTPTLVLATPTAATRTAMPTPTAALSSEQLSRGVEPGNSSIGLVVSIGLAALVVGLVVVGRFAWTRRGPG
jgi:BNR repeat-like domain